MPRVNIRKRQFTLDNAWAHYQACKSCVFKAAEQTAREVQTGVPVSILHFFNLNEDDIDKLLDEVDTQASLFLLASVEASLRVDFLKRNELRKKDTVSRQFRTLFKSVDFKIRKIRLDEDILDTWLQNRPASKKLIGMLRGALNYRHWLAHGRYWEPKLGENYNPVSIQAIVTELFIVLGIQI